MIDEGLHALALYGWTARDFAKWAVSQGVHGAMDVQVYLDSFWTHVPART